MKKLIQVITASVLILALILGIQPEPAAAFYYQQPEFVIDSSGKLTKYQGNGGKVTIPDEVNEIGDGAFKGSRDLISVEMSDHVTRIGNGAFESCYNMTSIRLSRKLKTIADNAFWGCTSLSSVELPASLTEVGMCAFTNVTSLETIYIPKNVSSIGNYAFGFVYQTNYDPLPNITILSDGNKAAIDYASKYGFDHAAKKDLAVKLTSAKKASSKQMTIKWKKNKHVRGYELEYSTSSKFTASKTKSVKLTADKSTKSLKAKKGNTYYVRIRGYQSSGDSYYYSPWSSVQKVRIF